MSAYQAEPAEYRAGFIAIIGRPNVGKSTLMNALLGQKVAAVSPRPQTTRQRQLGILTLDNAQLILIDTPGLHIPHHLLGRSMNSVAQEALEEADAIVWIVDTSQAPSAEDEIIADKINHLKPLPPLLLALNKVDLVENDMLTQRQQEFQQLTKKATVFPISALNRIGLSELQSAMIASLPAGSPFYSADQITDHYEREIAADLVRESALNYLRDEVPHALAVRVDEYKERSDQLVYISATLFVEKESQKGIVIGHSGEMLKQIGIAGRQSIEEMSGRKVYLDLHVKVDKNWRNNPHVLRRMGYKVEEADC